MHVPLLPSINTQHMIMFYENEKSFPTIPTFSDCVSVKKDKKERLKTYRQKKPRKSKSKSYSKQLSNSSAMAAMADIHDIGKYRPILQIFLSQSTITVLQSGR